MTSAARLLERNEVSQEELQQLRVAFSHFRDASLVLEQKYDQLRSEALRLRQELEKKDQTIRKQERLASLGEMAALVAHEVRNPLGAMKLFVSLLNNELTEQGNASEYAQHISRSLDSLEQVVAHILEYASTRTLVFAPLNLHALIQESTSMINHEFGATVSLELKLNAHPFILGNEEALRQVFNNLLRNAAQAVQPQGHVTIHTHDMDQGLIRIEIQDNGPGIPTEQADKIFEPFFTSKHYGTGLGLALVQRSVLAHDGSIRLESAQGAKFTIELPRSQPKHLDKIEFDIGDKQ